MLIFVAPRQVSPLTCNLNREKGAFACAAAAAVILLPPSVIMLLLLQLCKTAPPSLLPTHLLGQITLSLQVYVRIGQPSPYDPQITVVMWLDLQAVEQDLWPCAALAVCNTLLQLAWMLLANVCGY
jgi:hypothetical protein